MLFHRRDDGHNVHAHRATEAEIRELGWTICLDTLCGGFEPVLNGDGEPFIFASEESALENAEEDEIVCRLSEVGHKTIYK